MQQRVERVAFLSGRHGLLAGLVLVALLCATVLAALAVQRDLRRYERGHFGAAAQTTVRAVERRLDRHLDAVHGVRALFDASMEVTRTEFQDYVASLQLPARLPGLLALAYSRRVEAPASGGSAPLSATPCMQPRSAPPPGRAHYYTIDYVEPVPVRPAAAGPDAAVERACLEALERALASGEATATSRVVFEQDGRQLPGFMLLVPVWDHAAPRTPDGAPPLRGVLVAHIVGAELCTGAARAAGIAIELYAGAAADPQGLLYAFPARTMEGDDARLSDLVTLSFGDRAFALRFRAFSGFHAGYQTHLPGWTLVGGGLLSLLIFAAVLTRGRQLAERNLQQLALSHQATHDRLTGLPNRWLLEERLQRRLAALGEGDRLTLLFIDLDGFKEINNTLGHPVGDRLLQQLGSRLQEGLAPEEFLARLGGDEFALLSAQPESQYSAIERAKRVLDTLTGPVALDEVSLQVGASIGIALAPNHARQADDLARFAEVAMYTAKRTKSSYAVYDPEQDRHSPQRLAMLGGLRQAMEQQQFFLAYQPKVALATGTVTGVEALLRWQHPQHGLLSPGDFIPLAETSAFIQPLTSWVLEHAIRECKAWYARGLAVPVAINISAHNLLDAHLPQRIADLLARYDLGHDCLELEITESALIDDPPRAHALLARLHERGVRIAIDDFGTGYSSLSYLKRLPVSALKVDASFVHDLAQDENDMTIVQSTVQLAHNLGLYVVAEGVESTEVLHILRGFGCDQGQGFFICPPLSAEAVRQLPAQLRTLVP